MRNLLVLVLAASLLSGCLREPDETGATEEGSDIPQGIAPGPAPAPLHWEGDILVGADPFNVLPTDPRDPTSLTAPPPCSQKPNGQDLSCRYHDFTTNTTADLRATLAWGLQANDLDLYLFQGPYEVSRDGINEIGIPAVPPPVPPQVPTEQVMDVAALPAGTYTFWVVLWNAALDAYTLDAEFS